MRAVVGAGVDWVQVRDRRLESAELIALVDEVSAAAREGSRHGTRVVVNRRTDVALAAGADGVHLGFDGVEPRTARRLFADLDREGALVGVSVHAPDELRGVSGASYAHLAPIHPPLSKASTRPALGLDALAAAARGPVPVIAQGGIDAENAAAVVASGAAGVAVTGAILGADDPARATAALRTALDR